MSSRMPPITKKSATRIVSWWGDTLWLEVNAPTTLTHVQTGRVIDYSGAENLGSAIAFQAFFASTRQFTVEAVKSFDFVLVKGKEVMNRSPERYMEYTFAESGNKYIFQLGVIPKEKGTFRLVLTMPEVFIAKTITVLKLILW